MKQIGTSWDRTNRNIMNENFTEADRKVLEQKQRVDRLIQDAPQPSEVVDARGEHAVLGDRLNEFNAQLAQKEKVIRDIVKISVRDYGAVGNGIADDSLAIQQAVDNAPVGAKILVGNHYCDSKLIIDKRIEFIGQTYTNASSYSNDFSGFLFNENLDIAIECLKPTNTSGNITFTNVVIKGAKDGNSRGIGIGIKATGTSIILNNSTIQRFHTPFEVSNGYYCKFYNSYVGYSGNGGIFNNCYNIVASGLAVDYIDNIGIQLNGGSTMRMLGGSVEHCKVAGFDLTTGSQVTLLGTYFENDSGYDIRYGKGCSINVIGAQVYPMGTNGFIGAYSTETSTGARIFSRNNQFTYPTTSSGYLNYRLLVNDPTAYIDIAGDNWKTDMDTNIRYIDHTWFNGQKRNIGNYNIILPSNHPLTKTGDISNMHATTTLEAPKPLPVKNNWVASSGGYYKDNSNLVHVQGILTGGTGTNGTALMTLPSEYAPTETRTVTAVERVDSATTKSIILQIYSSGNVNLYNSVSNNVYLDFYFRI